MRAARTPDREIGCGGNRTGGPRANDLVQQDGTHKSLSGKPDYARTSDVKFA